MKRIALISFFIFLLASPCPKGLICSEQIEKLPSLEKDTSAIERSLFELVNKEREKFGLFPLRFSQELSLIARNHSQDMASHENIFHLSPSGKDYAERLLEAGCFFMKYGENVAFSETFVAEFIHQGFMESQGHRANIIDPEFDEAGIGVIFKEDNGYYITQDFIKIVVPKDEEEAEAYIQKKINGLRRENFLPPISFIEEASEYAQTHSLSKAENKPPPPVQSNLGQTHIVYITSPSLEGAGSVYKDKILDEIYESAGLGISFSRSKEYPGGAYFITLILFPENKYKFMSNKDLKELIFATINKIREKKGINRFKWDGGLTARADQLVKRIRTQKEISGIAQPESQRTAFFSYVTENPNLLPESLKEKFENDLIGYRIIGIGVLFGKDRKFPRGTFWVSVLLEE